MTKPAARLFMCEFGGHNVNGLKWDGLAADNFERVLPTAGWRIDYLGTTTYEGNYSPETVESMAQMGLHRPELAERMKPTDDQLRAIAPMLENHRVHMPFWSVAATRLD